MPAPPVLPEWDSDETHVTATTAGHKSDGYVSDEIPASDEMNYWMNLVYVWIAWLKNLKETKTIFVPLAGTGFTTGGTVGNVFTAYFPLKVGDVVTNVKLLTYRATLGANEAPTLWGWDPDLASGGTNGIANLTALTPQGSGPGVTEICSTDVNITIGTDPRFLFVGVDSTITGSKIFGAIVTYTPAA